MSTCKYCGKSAGFFSKSHKVCEKIFQEGKQSIAEEIMNYFKSSTYKNLDLNIRKIAINSFVDEENLSLLIYNGYSAGLDYYLEDGLLNDEEIQRLDDYFELFQISDDYLIKSGAKTKIVKSMIIRDILLGDEIQNRVKIPNQLPFILENDEKIIWVFEDVELLELKLKTKIVGGSQGVSVRVAKGLYYKVGAFKGEPIKTEEIKNTATGILLLTNKSIFYGSVNKTFKVKYSQIISIPTFDTAIGIQQSRVNSKPLYFRNVDVWFVYNVISNLSKINQ